MRPLFILLISLLIVGCTQEPSLPEFYLGADLSYTNEMEDCGVIFKENNQEKDPFRIFKDHNANLVRLRLWHTPKWYDSLNSGKRYSDLKDVKRSIRRVKDLGMKTLLDFHLSDNWADPKKQVAPEAWWPVLDNLDILSDSLYLYIFGTLSHLDEEGLLPEMVQIGNETNREILLSPEINAKGWRLNWDRNAVLFKRGIQAVRDFEKESGKTVKIVLHVAAPDNAEWMIRQYVDHGVRDFDIIGLSYYWAWHYPTTIEETGEVISQLRHDYQDKEVMVVETGYIWTRESNDQAANIISKVHPDFPPSPLNQKAWLKELTQEVISAGGIGVLYWEPAWVSSPCFTLWGKGSHQEHATFFDFDNHLLIPGGIEWMEYSYDQNEKEHVFPEVRILGNSFSGDVEIICSNPNLEFQVVNQDDSLLISGRIENQPESLSLGSYPHGIYRIKVMDDGNEVVERLFKYSSE